MSLNVRTTRCVSAVFLLLMVCTVLSGCVPSPTVYYVSGRVTYEETGLPVPGVVLAFGSFGAATSGPDGRWAKTGLSGFVTVVPSKGPGWSFKPPMRIVTGPNSSVDFVSPLGWIEGWVYKHAQALGVEGEPEMIVIGREMTADSYVPLQGATVTVESGPSAGTTVSGADGHFVLLHLIPGEYVITVTHPRFTGLRFIGLQVVSGQATSIGQTPLGSLHMLFIGIADYAYIPDLNYTEADATTMAGTLYFDNYLAGQYSTVLGSAATKQAIRNSIQAIGSAMNYQDTFIMFFSGHGAGPSPASAPGIPSYMCPYDGWNEGTFIADYELRSWIDQYIPYSQSHRSIFIFDSCHAGGMFKAEALLGGLVLGAGIGEFARNLSGDGHIVIAACDETESSVEGPQFGGGHGLFTWVFTEGMKIMAADVNHDGWVTVQEAFNYASYWVPRHYSSQHPQMWIGNQYGGAIYSPLY
ncbi:MAG: caspase family protein [Firmicutes bacterium]|jgi:hypothetical protein|nr:caspase family protein [Bacillota bacterium]